MALDYFINALENGMIPQPNEMYRNLQQAFITQQWDNTTALYTLLEQDMTETGEFPTFTFHQTEAWLNYVVGQTSSGLTKIVPLYGNIYRNLLNCWKILRASLLQREDEICLSVKV